MTRTLPTPSSVAIAAPAPHRSLSRFKAPLDELARSSSALEAASAVLPRNERPHIDGFPARAGVLDRGYEGVLGAPPAQRPRPFELVFETPQAAPEFLQEVFNRAEANPATRLG